MSSISSPSNTPIEIIAAVVVLYFPDLKILNNLLESLKPQVGKLYLICNGIDEQCKAALIQEHQYTQLIELENNPGLGRALNVGMQKALDDHIEYLFLFDQDSDPGKEFIQDMIEQLNEAQAIENQKGASSQKVAAIGPSFYDARSTNLSEGARNKFKKDGKAQKGSGEANSPIECDCLITSGMLIHLSKIEPAIFFDESYFVDHVDSEWCFRTRFKSYAIYGSKAVAMGHRISDARVLHLGSMIFLSYSPFRRYLFYRNSVRLIKSGSTSLRWKFRLSVIMAIWFLPNLFLDRHSASSLIAMLSGIRDGFLNRYD